MLSFLLWIVLFIVSWPLAILALLLFPIVWLIALPFRMIGITVDALFSFLKALLFLPSRILSGRR